ncbi:Hypothetical predicted protein [Mytilus galloprovincialis]|uniref:CCHC-type domain-containing protein n=1 Tax=Mytilus galloprovincialis TaxID=29158 RepID=A0A8B6E2L9_MYTGA|nr:Hypothetical predicted protein [Mytilus galloprovincialis]
MADENVDPKSSSKSHAEAASPRYQPSNDQSVSEVKTIFILEQDLFGSSKPSQDQYLTHLELYRAVEHLVDPSHLKALQRVRGLWRLYFDNHKDRDKTLTNGKYKAVVLHRGQVDTRTNITCNKCLQEGHKSYECPNDWVCRTCGGSGHKASYCTTCPDDWVCQTCGKSGHTAKYCNADSDSSSEDSQSESESDSDIPTHPESCQKDVSQTTQAADAEHKTPSFTFNKQASNNLDDHSNLSEKKANRMSKKLNEQKIKRTNKIQIKISRAWNVS